MNNDDLISSNIEGYSVLRKPEAREQLELFRKLINLIHREARAVAEERFDGICWKLFHDSRGGKSWIVEYHGKKYLLKLDKRERHRADYLIQSFFLGSNAARLMRTLYRANRNGFNRAAEIFLIADKRSCGCVLHSFYLQEYVEGEDLKEAAPEIYMKYSGEAEKIVQALHKFGCAHGDVHRGNFILEESSGHLKAIDIGGKIPSKPQKALDRIRLESEWGIKNTQFDWGYYWVRVHKAWRHFHLRDFLPHRHRRAQ